MEQKEDFLQNVETKLQEKAEPVKRRRGRPKGSKSKQKENIPEKRDERGVRKQVYNTFDPNYAAGDLDEMGTMYEMAKKNMQTAKRKRGQHSPYNTAEELEQAIDSYWDYLIKASERGVRLIPDVEGLAAYLGVSRTMLLYWETRNYKGFSETVMTAKNNIAACKKQLALAGKIPPIVFATDFNNNHGYVQKQEISVSQAEPMGEKLSLAEISARIEGNCIVEDVDFEEVDSEVSQNEQE